DHATVSVVQEHSDQSPRPVVHIDCGEYRNVAGAVCDCYHESPPGLPALELGHVLADNLGLGGVCGDDWSLHDLHLPVRASAADDHDLRIAHAAAGRAGEGTRSAM